MYVRFERPPVIDGKAKTVVLPGKGLLIGRAVIGVYAPMLSDVEMLNFGIWRDANDDLQVTVPAAGNNFAVLAPKSVNGKAAVLGQQQIEWLLETIIKTWKANRANEKTFFDSRFEIAAETAPGMTPAADEKAVAAAKK